MAPFNDPGDIPFILDVDAGARRNEDFRRSVWTGKYLQMTLMSLANGQSIGLESHKHTDQLLRIESGVGWVQMGPSQNDITIETAVQPHCVIFIPAGTWHNLTNIGHSPLKLTSIYAPPEHPQNTVHHTKKDAEENEHHY